ncbi:MAG TPA: glycoside hydrolase family 95 protein [Albitalea sp.]|uniref:glycoside hydrolase family 95 protein n=1 Tax=Piscinibacter sp. TaxID=1903157 RepID=UPI002ED65E0E
MKSRRRFLATAGLALALPGLARAKVVATERGDREDLSLWYEQPAGPWIEALPVGNGRVGAMVFGRMAQERVQLNIDTLSGGGPYTPDNPAALEALPRVRALLEQGRWHEASDLAGTTMMARPMVQMPYGAAGDLFLDTKGLRAPAGLRRWLDLDSAIAATRFTDGRVRHLREVFCSEPDQVLVVRLSTQGGSFDLDLGYRHPADAEYGAKPSDARTGAVSLVGAPWNHREPLREGERPTTLAIGPDGDAALLVQGRNVADAGIASALRFAVRIKAVSDGLIDAVGDRIEVRGARTLTLLVAAATSHVRFDDVSGDPVSAVCTRSEAASRTPYERLKQRHVQSHRALFRRLSIRIGSGAADPRPTHERIFAAATEVQPALAALYVQYARYLLISSSRPGSEPANLQGRWNEGNHPPWGGKFTININTQMNYWPAGPGNLGECVEPLLRMVEELSITGARTARTCYGARGWVAHHNTDLWRAAAPVDGPLWGLWPCGGAWLCNTLWDHYEYHPDPATLRRLHPLLKGASLFFLDTLVEDPEGRGLVTSPSISPENEHHPGVALCAGPAMDRQILRDLFDHTMRAHALLGEPDDDFMRALRNASARLPADRIGTQGQLQEWLDDWDAAAPDPRHRHVSHLYAVYPSGRINLRDTPELAQAAKVTLNARGDQSTGWATAWRLALWARLGEGERAHSILQGLLGPVRTYPNMFDSHPPFQIDGNFGGAAGILEMIVQSWGGQIHLLPALPKYWDEGELRGVRVRGGIELDVRWSGGRPVRVALRGPARTRLALRCGGRSVAVTLDGAGRALLAGRGLFVNS